MAFDRDLPDVRADRLKQHVGVRHAHAGEEHREFLAAQAPDQAAVAFQFEQPARHRDEQLVADAVPTLVVHAFEVVQVDEARGQLLAQAHVREHQFAGLDEMAAVERGGQRIQPRALGQFFLRQEVVAPRMVDRGVHGHRHDPAAERLHPYANHTVLPAWACHSASAPER